MDRKIILKLISKRMVCEMDWIHLAEDRDQWEDCVNRVMNLLVP
jgi:hypothetical protein